MKTLVQVTNVENGFVFYNEINRKTGLVMIADYMKEPQFIKAINSKEFGFNVVQKNYIGTDMQERIAKAAKTKAGTIKLIESITGTKVNSYEYWRGIRTLSVELSDGCVYEASTKRQLLNFIYRDNK